jgi:CubicO group peptidase (beta-lactamase class C family)
MLCGMPDIARADHHDLDRRLAQLEAAGVSGTVLLARRGEPVLQRCLGLADRAAAAPVTPDTAFATASVTKMLTATAVLDQVVEGVLALHTPVVDVVPPDRRPRHLRADVTVHHLLCHTSGIADYFEEDDDLRGDHQVCGDDYGALWDDLPPSRMERPADFLPLYRDLAPYGPPGQVWRYSNAGYVLLAEVVEQLTGRSCQEVVADRVLQRAGMTDSGFWRSDEPRAGMAMHYLPSGRTNVHRVPVLGGGDGGCVCTAADLVRFCRALVDGTLLGDLTDLMLRRHARINDGSGPEWHYGYGLMLYPDGRFGHGGGDPGVSAMVNHWPDRDVTVVSLCNVEEYDDGDPAVALRDAVLEGVSL